MLPINKNNIKKIHSIAFSINGAYIIFDNQFLAWIPKTENLYFDSLDYLYKEPIEFNSNLFFYSKFYRLRPKKNSENCL